MYLKLVGAALMLPALNTVGIPVLNYGTVYSSTLPRLGIGGFFHGVGRELVFCFYYITSPILIHAFLCASARRFCVSVCVCVFMHPCVGECGGRGTLSTVPQDPSIFFVVVEAKSFPWSLLIQAASSRLPPVSSSLMLELQADTDPAFFFFF